MKTKNLFLSLAFIVTLASCSKEADLTTKATTAQTDNTQLKSDYSSEISQQRVALGESLIESLKSNKDLSTNIIKECNNRFDDDREVLVKTLCEKSPIFKSEVNTTFKASSQKNSAAFKAKQLSNDFIGSLVENDNDLQIYYYCNIENNDFDGIVIVPENKKEHDGKSLLCINKDGSKKYISDETPPANNYLVISRNERSEIIKQKVQAEKQSQVLGTTKQKVSSFTDGVCLITKARFSSYNAKLLCESWYEGEPEVRLYVIYPDVVRNGSLISVQLSDIPWSQGWLKLGAFKNDVKDNWQRKDLPYWTAEQKPWGRYFKWVEEDSPTHEDVSFEISYTNKDTGFSTKATYKLPKSKGEYVIGASWIYPYEAAGTKYIGNMEFDLWY
jgi:hypothetical protein